MGMVQGKGQLLLCADTTSVMTIKSPYLSLSQTYRWKGWQEGTRQGVLQN